MIQLNDVCVSFGEKEVLSHLTASLGRITAVTGVSGSGKTTLLRVLLGLLRPDSGAVLGLEGSKLSAVFQEDRLIGSLDAVGNVALVLPRRFPREEIQRHLALVGLSKDDILCPATELSGGMSRRVAVVRAVLCPAAVTVMDEPFKGLDDETRQLVVDYVENYTIGRTLVFSTHEKSDIAALGASELIIPLLDKERLYG